MMSLALLVAPFAFAQPQQPCEELVARWAGISADMHDGDRKLFWVESFKATEKHKHTMTINPYSSDQSWEIKAKISSKHCNASVDFNVPGKADHPPVPLTARFYHLNALSKYPGGTWKMATEFNDPSGTLNAPGYPLNHWVVTDTWFKGEQLGREARHCPKNFTAVYADMHDGDEKEVHISGHNMTIRSNNKSQGWAVHAYVNRKRCSAVIDFNVPGKPSPPPVSLTATLWHASLLNTNKADKTVLEFTDPTSTAAWPYAGYPLNHWVELPPVAKGKCCYGASASEGCGSATTCPSNPSCDSADLCKSTCGGTWCNTASEEMSV